MKDSTHVNMISDFCQFIQIFQVSSFSLAFMMIMDNEWNISQQQGSHLLLHRRTHIFLFSIRIRTTHKSILRVIGRRSHHRSSLLRHHHPPKFIAILNICIRHQHVMLSSSLSIILIRIRTTPRGTGNKMPRKYSGLYVIMAFLVLSLSNEWIC